MTEISAFFGYVYPSIAFPSSVLKIGFSLWIVRVLLVKM